MRIAFMGNAKHSHCTEVHLAATMRSLGHDVTFLQEDETDPDTLVDQVAGHDLFWFVRTWGQTLTMAHLIRLQRLGIPSVSYHLDLYVGISRQSGMENDPFWYTSYVFTPDGSAEAAEVFNRMGVNHYWMPPGVFRDECYMAKPSGRPREVIFVGGGKDYGHPEWPYRRQLVEWLEATYGRRYRKYGGSEGTVRGAQLNQLYADSKIAIGDSVHINGHYWSDRITETMGRGGFIIHPRIEGVEEFFTDREHCVFYTYGNFDQLRELIDYYLAHDTERERIRRAGHEHVKANHTYHNRLETVFRLLAADGIGAS